jgi:S1-C subfamily serine protease
VRYRDLRGEQVKLGILIEDAGGPGVRVTGVLPGGPGHAAGLLAGDLIVAVDGTEVSAASNLIHEVSRHKRGEKGTIEVLRGGKRVPLAVTYDVLTHGN